MRDSKNHTLRILQVNKAYFPHIGGVESIVAQIAEGLGARDGFEVRTLVCNDEFKSVVEVVNGASVERASTFGQLLRMPLSLDFFPRFRRMASESDAILLHHPFPLGFLAARILVHGQPTFVWYHADIVRQRISGAMLTPLWNSVLDRATKIFVSNRRLLASSKVLRRFASKCAVIPFGLDSRRFDSTPAITQAALEIRARYGAPLLLAVGRLVYYKGFEFLVEAMKGQSAKLLIVGSGPLEKPLLELTRAHGVADRVHIIASVPDLTPYYHACDVFVLPSVAASEAFGLVQMEAMACGKPVINTNLPTGVIEVSVHNETGLTVPPRDSAALSEAIGQLLSDTALRNRFGAAAKIRIITHFDLDRFVDRVAEELRAGCGYGAGSLRGRTSVETPAIRNSEEEIDAAAK